MTKVETTHVWLDEKGRAWIDDTNTKVIEVVLDKIGFGLSPEEIHTEHPHLSLAQIHGALAYYYDHQSDLDAQIAEREQLVAAMRAAQGVDTPLHRKLRAMGKIP